MYAVDAPETFFLTLQDLNSNKCTGSGRERRISSFVPRSPVKREMVEIGKDEISIPSVTMVRLS